MSFVAGARRGAAGGMKQNSLLELLLTIGVFIAFPRDYKGCWVSKQCDSFMSFTAVFKN